VAGHYHPNVTSVEVHKKFSVDTLGGTTMKFGSAGVEVIRFPGVYLSLRQQPPTDRHAVQRCNTSASLCRTSQ